MLGLDRKPHRLLVGHLVLRPDPLEQVNAKIPSKRGKQIVGYEPKPERAAKIVSLIDMGVGKRGLS